MLEAILVFVPLIAFPVWTSDRDFPETTLRVVAGGFIAANAFLVWFWVTRRIVPIDRELEELGVAATPDDGWARL